MPIRKLLVLTAMLGFLPLKAVANEAAPKAEKSKADKRETPASGGTAKAGEACKVDNDCDQSGRAMICGRGKCEYDVSKMPVKT
jgi:hypothetical protein